MSLVVMEREACLVRFLARVQTIDEQLASQQVDEHIFASDEESESESELASVSADETDIEAVIGTLRTYQRTMATVVRAFEARIEGALPDGRHVVYSVWEDGNLIIDCLWSRYANVADDAYYWLLGGVVGDEDCDVHVIETRPGFGAYPYRQLVPG